MSASLLVAMPSAVLAVVLSLCFVGCVLDREGAEAEPGSELFGPPFTQYSTLTILPTPGLVSYWPLGEAAGAIFAADAKDPNPPGVRKGTYKFLNFPADMHIDDADAVPLAFGIRRYTE